MIIKSIPHKVRDFGRLIDYIDNEEKITTKEILYNFLSNDKVSIKNEFIDNSQLLQNRKGANYLYHDIISLEENTDLDLKEQEKILLKLGDKYLNRRFKGCLAYGKIHKDRRHLHLHICISSNRAGEGKRVYYSKKHYLKIKQEIESYKIKEFQNLKEKVLYNKEYLKQGYSQKEYEVKRRTRKPSHRETTRERLKNILINSNSKDDLLLKLERANLTFYETKYKKIISVRDLETKRGYGLKTLGVYGEYMEAKDRLTQKDTIREKLRANRETQEREKQKENIKPSQSQKLSIKEKLKAHREEQEQSISQKEELKQDERPKEKLSIKDKLKAHREQQEQEKQSQKYNLKPKIK